MEISTCSSPHLWSRAVGIDRKKEIMNTSGHFYRRVARLSFRDRVRSSEIQEALRVEPMLLHIERSQLRWFGHLGRMPPGRHSGEVFWACLLLETLRHTQNTLERLHLLSDLGRSQDPHWCAGGSVKGECGLCFLLKLVPKRTRPTYAEVDEDKQKVFRR